VDVRGGSYHWLQFRRSKEAVEDPDCDLGQLMRNKITITPLRPDPHAEGDFGDLQARFGAGLAVEPEPVAG
jgi:broad specificity polyphosphatase/5'/3'-nucleotidase SurE